MHPTEILAVALLAGSASAHGVVTMIKGANGVNMPGLSIIDGTPRNCASPLCGSEADTSIIRDREISSGKASALGRTQGGGPVDAAKMVATFMGGAKARRADAGNTTELEFDDDEEDDELEARHEESSGGVFVAARQLFKGLLGGGGKGAGGSSGTKSTGSEQNVAAMAGQGASSGLPTCADDGTIEMVFHQVNQDGAGPISAAVDGTSGGTDASAFKTAQVTQDVPGAGFGGLSLAQTTDFPLKVQMPAGMTCDATVAGANNVCVVRVRNSALAGPFGGSAAFTQSAAARKRAIAFRRMKRAQAFAA